MVKTDFKDLQKAAFCLAFGLTLGKITAKCIASMIGGAGIGVLKITAKNGNEIAQNVCKKMNIDYKSEKETQEADKIVGFHIN